MTESTTHFGYEHVATSEKTSKVKSVFDSVANNYDVMNDLMSLGIHRLWKKSAIDECQIRPGQSILDLAGGTGDLSLGMAKKLRQSGQIVLSDINDNMLQIGRRKLIDQGFLGLVRYVQANAECLPWPNNTFDCITIAFGLRNVTDKDQALREMYRVLKPGGRLVILEFSHLVNDKFRALYDTYSFALLPFLGKVVANDAKSYQYLAESIRMHPDQKTLKTMMQNAEFERCEYLNLTGGICAIHKGFKF